MSGQLLNPIREIKLSHDATDAAGRMRSADPYTIGDYKSVNVARPLLFDEKGTASSSWSEGIYTMAVGVGEYIIRQTFRSHNYTSGNAQTPEYTFLNMAPEVGVTKRVGYFSSNTVAPYNSNLDGFWIESTVGGGIEQVISRYGVETARIPQASWENPLSGYDWDGFTVLENEFLWLGGTSLDLNAMIGKNRTHLYSYEHAGMGKTTTMIGSPNQPIRFEIRSTTGTGTLKQVCAKVSTSGQFSDVGMPGGIKMDSPCNANVIGTQYAVMGIRLKSTMLREAFRDIVAGIRASSNNSEYSWSVQLNPTLNVDLTWLSHPTLPLEYGFGDTANTVSSDGHIIAPGLGSDNSVALSDLPASRIMGASIDGIPDELISTVTPQAANLDIYGLLKGRWK